jgi:PTS system mannose-specific IIA component
MIGVVLVTHGGLGTALLEVATWISGDDMNDVVNISVEPEDGPDLQAARIEQAVRRFDEGAVILTDLFGGTPQNLALSLLAEGRVDVVSGVNLPMLLALPSARARCSDVHSLALTLLQRAQGAMVAAGETLKRHAEASRELPAVES